MMYGRITLAITLLLATLLPNAGCLRRKETITVSPDQSVRIDVEYDDDTDKFGAPDAMPSKAAGWDTQTIAEKNDNGKMDYTLKASKTFAPSTPLPRNYAAPGDPDADLYLDFPTTLDVQRRDDGTVYTFRRVYTSRPWAYVQYWEDRVMDGDVKKLLDKPADQLTDEERVKILRALATVEVLRRVELSRTAIQRAGIDDATEGWLNARQALIDHVEEIDFAPFLEMQKQVESAPKDSPEKDAAEQKMQNAIEDLNASAFGTFDEQLRTSLDETRYAAYSREMDRVKKKYDITKATGGHAFEIRVKMPGRVIAQNADKIGDDGTAVWEFDGNAFRDRDFELVVVSRLQTPDTKMNQ